jgi:uncharacterized membrane protein
LESLIIFVIIVVIIIIIIITPTITLLSTLPVQVSVYQYRSLINAVLASVSLLVDISQQSAAVYLFIGRNTSGIMHRKLKLDCNFPHGRVLAFRLV